MLLTQPNQKPQTLIEWHWLPLPQCCPVSGNPQPGSFIGICYVPSRSFLEVYSLRKYVTEYVGGRDGVRDMEGMVQQIAQDCANEMGVYVYGGALIVLQRGDGITLFAGANPE